MSNHINFSKARMGCALAVPQPHKRLPIQDSIFLQACHLESEYWLYRLNETGGRNAGGDWNEHLDDSKEVWKRNA